MRSQVRLLKIAPKEGGPVDHLVRVRTSPVGKLYIKFLKPIAIVRILVIFFWRLSIPLLISAHNFLSVVSTKGQKYKLIALNAYVQHSGGFCHEVFPPESQKSAQVEVFLGKSKHINDDLELVSYFPSVRIASIANAFVTGGSNFIFTDGYAISHDLFSINDDYTSEELHHRHIIRPKKLTLETLVASENVFNANSIAPFLDACAHNYAHWLSEVLPRVAVFCQNELYANVPIVVDADLHPNIMDSLEYVVQGQRDVFVLPVGSGISARVAYVTSLTGYVPFQKRRSCVTNHGRFSQAAISFMRTLILSNIGHTTNLEIPERRVKLYLSRRSWSRALVNCLEVEDFARSMGFDIVDTTQLSFPEQVRLVSVASHVLAPTGAALANSIFCAPGTKVGVLFAEHSDMIYHYWRNMLSGNGIDFFYVIGQPKSRCRSSMHADYHVDLSDLRMLMRAWRIL